MRITKKQRAALNASVAARFPKGSGNGDPLATTLTLGQSYASVNSLQFSSVSKAKGLKPYSLK